MSYRRARTAYTHMSALLLDSIHTLSRPTSTTTLTPGSSLLSLRAPGRTARVSQKRGLSSSSAGGDAPVTDRPPALPWKSLQRKPLREVGTVSREEYERRRSVQPLGLAKGDPEPKPSPSPTGGAGEVDAGAARKVQVMVDADGFSRVQGPAASVRPCDCGRAGCLGASIIIAVGGACPRIGLHANTASCGVFFGTHGAAEAQNLVFRVSDHPHHEHTNQRAEVQAAVAALYTARKYTPMWLQSGEEGLGGRRPCPVHHIIIKSDSPYLADSMNGQLAEWAANDWRAKARDRPVRNVDLWKELMKLVTQYAKDDVQVSLWRVPRTEMSFAERLAKRGGASNLTFKLGRLQELPK